MSTQLRNQEVSAKAASPAQNQFQARPFAEETEADTLPAEHLRSSVGSTAAPPDAPIQPKPNSATGHFFSQVQLHANPIQPKLTIGQPNDPYEQEADQVADQVMKMAAPPDNPNIQRQTDESWMQPMRITPLVQRQVDSEELQMQPIWLATPLLQRQTEEEPDTLQLKPLMGSVQRQVEDEIGTESPLLQRFAAQSTSQQPDSTNTLESRLSRSQGGGSPLSDDVRTFMEPRFGYDFSHVRVHTDGEAVQMNRDLSAQAFTHGSNIYFGSGKFNANSDEGKTLLAHELTHVVQQTGPTPLNKTVHRQPVQPKVGAGTLRTKRLVDHTAPSDVNKGMLSPTKSTVFPQAMTGVNIQTKADPGQILEQLKNTPPNNIFASYDQAVAASPGALEAQKQQVQQSLPQLPAPTGLPAKKGGPAAETSETGVATGGKNPTIATIKDPTGQSKTPLQVNVKEAPPPLPIIPTRLLGADSNQSEASDKSDAKLAQSAQNSLEGIHLDTSQISTDAEKPPVVDLTSDTNPAQMDTAQQESDKQVSKAKVDAAKDIHRDFGEKDIFPDGNKEILKAKKALSVAQISAGKNDKTPEIPAEILGQLNQSLGPTLKEKLSGQQEKYIEGKQKFDKDSAKAKTDADKEIAKLTQETTQKQLKEQQLAKTEVNNFRQEWQTELSKAEKDYQQKAKKATQDQKQKIAQEKQKGEKEAAAHFEEAEKQAAAEKHKAEQEAGQKKQESKKESGGFWGWVKSKASALIDGLKKAINFIYDNLRKAVKFIFEQAKKLALAAIELARKVIVGLIKGFGEILKGLVSIAFAAFPEIAKKINSKIDKAVKTAEKAVNTAADLLKKGVAAVLDFLANTIDSLLGLIQSIYNGILTVVGMIVRGEFGELIKRLGHLVDAAKAAPPQFETAAYEELLGGNLDEPLSPVELAQAAQSGIMPSGTGGSSSGQSHSTEDLPKAPWSEANIGVDAVEQMDLSPEMSSELLQKTNGDGEVELASSDDSSRTMDAVMAEATGEKEGGSQEGKEQKNPDDGLSPQQRAEIRWQLMKKGIADWWSKNWPTVLIGATAAIGGFIALNIVTGGAITAALPAIMSVVGPLFVGVTIAQIGGHVRDYLAKSWDGDVPGGGKSLAKGLAAGAIELASYLTFKVGGAALKGAKAVAKGVAKGAVKLAKGAVNLIVKGAKFIIEKGKVLFKGLAGSGLGKQLSRLREMGEALLSRLRFKKFRIRIANRMFRLEGYINPWILIAEGKVVEVDEIINKEPRIGDEVKAVTGEKGKLLSPGDKFPEALKQTIEENATKGKKDLFSLFDVQPGKNLNLDVPSASNGGSYITYVFKNADDEIVYVGKASIPKGTPKQALSRRLAAGHKHFSPGLKPEIVATQISKQACAGAEEFFKQGYQKLGTKLTNIDNALSMRSDRLSSSIAKIETFLEDLAAK